MPIAITTPPGAQPVTLEQIKQHLRLDTNDEDELLNSYCDAATEFIEAHISKFLIERNVRQFVDGISESKELLLEAEPVSEITLVRGYDVNGNPHDFSSDVYRFFQYESPPRLFFDKSNLNLQTANGIEIDMVAGYGESGTDIPQNIIRALLVLIAHWYEHRGTNAAGETYGTIPEGFDKLLAPVRRVSL